jgi:predicted NBD/HSP70 family sugar kinase
MNVGSTAALSEVAQAIFASLLGFGEATRKMLAESAGLSFPTVTVALAELTAKAFVCELRREQGARGRATIVYGVSDEAGWVMGVDIGSTQVSFTARALNGRIFEQDSVSRRGAVVPPGVLAGELAAKYRARPALRAKPLAVAVALNQVVPRQLVVPGRPRPMALEICETFVKTAGLPLSVPVLLENNVNCAAVAEHHDGLMHGHSDAAYMQIGVGLGLGFFSDGALIRGGQGGSGELAQIALSWDRTVASPPDAIEHVFGSIGLLQNASNRWPDQSQPPASTEELFLLARSGNPVAKRLMEEHGIALGRIAAAACTILDPSILVLGGGLSRNPDFAALIIDEFCARNRETQIAVSEKDADASVNGACLLARDLALRHLIDRSYRPLLLRPTLLAG